MKATVEETEGSGIVVCFTCQPDLQTFECTTCKKAKKKPVFPIPIEEETLQVNATMNESAKHTCVREIIALLRKLELDLVKYLNVAFLLVISHRGSESELRSLNNFIGFTLLL